MEATVSDRLGLVRERIDKAAARAGRKPGDITLVAVTKTIPFEKIEPFLRAGVAQVGENRVQEALTKYQGADGAKLANVAVHLIGQLQSNKAKKAAAFFDLVQSLDRLALADDLNRHAVALDRVLPCLVEVKISQETTKSGLPPEQLEEFLAQLKTRTSLSIQGLMGIAPLGGTAEEARPAFRSLRRLFDKAKLSILSMGMSHDFEVAIEEGSTMVRLGTALFGGTRMKRLVLVGGGNMGEALIAGLVRSKHWKPSQITVTDVRPDQLERLQKTYKVRTSADNRWAVRDADIVLLSVKPQHVKHVLEDLGPVLRPTQLVMSIAAGISMEFIGRFLDREVPVIRVMPNTPALVGAGAAGIAAGRRATEAHLKVARAILETVGTVTEVSEQDMDAVTAVSGSGPAYVFFLAEAMAEAGVALGLTPHVADHLVRQTIKGAGQLLAGSHEGPATLRQRVTSPGGTTEAAIRHLEKAGLKRIFTAALKGAAQRSRELSKEASQR